MYKVAFTLLFIFQLQLLSAQTLKEINVVSESWPSLTNKDGSGLYFDIVRMVYEPLNIKVKIKIYPYARASMMVDKKLADVWLGSYLDEEDYAIYPKYSFDQDVVTAMYKKEKFPSFKGLEDLRNKNVCWVRGYGYDKYIEVPMLKNERNDRKSILHSLQKDRFDFFLDDKYDMQEAITRLKFDTSGYSFVELLKFNLYPAFRDDAKGKELNAIWNIQC